MKNWYLGICVGLLSMITVPAFAGENKNNADKKTTGINWVSLEEAEKLMKKKPKKVLIDVYTSWCGWCKVMDKKTYENTDVIAYLNKHFYAIKLDAEQKTPFTFQGQKFEFKEENRANEFAIQLLRGRMSYPSTVFFDENFTNPQPLAGYLDPGKLEMIVKYIAENKHKEIAFDQYQTTFIPTWKVQGNE